MQRQKEKVFKLALPLKFKMEGQRIIVEDKYGNSSMIKNAESFSMGLVDDDGFVCFSVVENLQKEGTNISLAIPSQSKAHINGYSLFHTNVSNSFGYGGQKSIFEYYKRDSDLSYYAIIKKEGKPSRKVLLGSMREPDSRIFEVASTICRNFSKNEKFDKSLLTKCLPSSFGARIVKATLDVLSKEGYLVAENATSEKRNRPKEVFVGTDMLLKYLVDPRSWKKPNGLNIGSLAVTSNQ